MIYWIQFVEALLRAANYDYKMRMDIEYILLTSAGAD